MNGFPSRGELLLKVTVVMLLAVAVLLVPALLRADTFAYNSEGDSVVVERGLSRPIVFSPSAILTDPGFQEDGGRGHFLEASNLHAHHCRGCLGHDNDLFVGDTATEPPTTAPEPSTVLLLISGVAAVPLLRRRRVNA